MTAQTRATRAGRGASGRIGLPALRSTVAAVLATTGLPQARAELVADSLVDAEARGVGSHGVARTRIYVERLHAGLLDPQAEPEVHRRSVAAALVDGHHAIGHAGAAAGLDAAAEAATSGGVGVAGVANSGHCGTLAYFARRATRRGLVAIAMSTAPPTMAFHGGRTRAVGTNPFCLAVPRRDAPPIVLDMATSATARGKIILAARAGSPIPLGWAVDRAGVATTDPEAALAGSVLPFAGPKGSGLAMMIDLLCGGLVSGVMGAAIGDMYEDWTRAQRVSHLFLVLDPEAWLGSARYLDAVEDYVASVHALPPAAGHEGVLLPGEVEERALAEAEARGVLLPDGVLADLRDLATDVGVDAPSLKE